MLGSWLARVARAVPFLERHGRPSSPDGEAGTGGAAPAGADPPPRDSFPPSRPVEEAGRKGTNPSPREVPGGGAGSGLRPIAAAALLAEEPPPLVWVWEPFLLEGGLVVLAASPKVGKSTLAAALAVAVAQGRPFLGYRTKQRAVLILALEEHRRDVRRRLERSGLRPEDPLSVQCDPFQLSAEHYPELAHVVRSQEIGLIVVDTLGRFWTVRDENDNVEIERALGLVLELARRTGVCVLLVHHERKRADERGPTGETILGGSELLALVDQALLLRRREATDCTPGRAAPAGPCARGPARLLTLRDAAAYLGVSYWTVRSWVESGRLPHVRLPGRRLLRIDRADLDRLVEAYRVA